MVKTIKTMKTEEEAKKRAANYMALKGALDVKEERMYNEAVEFAEWIRSKDFQTASKNRWIGLNMKYYTTEELFEQFKKK